MRVHTIEVDEEVFRYLQGKAQPFVDTPNAVLRRELLGRTASPSRYAATRARKNSKGTPGVTTPPSLSNMPFGTPAALQQTLWVADLVLANARARSEATADIAKILGVAPQTVLDKYCRQLGLTAGRFDQLLRQPDLQELEALLLKKFPDHADTVQRFFRTHRDAA